ncbi:bifunctional serine/threonine-protein kinase/formylglycine-generating enzyme family protein [Rhodopirellula sp. MGV]|uniref:bifunctional serine/threonine-protein kinase/formylglycine-generating enzyme family protein n=1 Tax=Rhodopirellula sp. MGV TaxID=2023130 RepID=UPI000B97C4A3|nr:bifunctional serine/threonine-protein kinase/formylglycine-generating enzyme family protein [Rhodopirellula sp. MGV]OYP31622.1 hypothetical protein CGZ80_20955 [Rhodopirellula sp. MGV]PNY33477.1 hypothetical protein C2E31_28730 [Rhodopirellula baltica]
MSDETRAFDEESRDDATVDSSQPSDLVSRVADQTLGSDDVSVASSSGKTTRTVHGDASGNSNDAEASGQAEGDFDDEIFLGAGPQIGRYRVDRRLASGGFGNVFLATDMQLQRRVAIKIPHQHRMSKSFNVERFLEEARTIASLDHPGVVPIYDVGKLHDRYYIVSKFIDGETLSKWIEAPRSGSQKVAILKSVAETLDFIHQEGIIHRDIKPANLLLDENERCYLTDFGLAMQVETLVRRSGKIGTYAYMSPEQARGENHLVDNRSDLFSLGVVMYEMLCGTRPFAGESPEDTLELICGFQPPPLREHNRELPKELERICMRLLSKRATLRYQNAGALADDLAWVLERASESDSWKSMVPTGTVRRDPTISSDGSKSADLLAGIVPRGLRAFDQEDADYFVKLLPGPFDRDGLPDSIRFWKRRIESRDYETAFRIGVIYGKSGSGKSSFVRAGLLPRLSSSTVVCFVSATPEDTDRQILLSIRQKIPTLPDGLSVTESIGWIRQNPQALRGAKLLLVIDQFEQWLHAHAGQNNTALALALRQCDGEHVQCLLLVRDDFWIGVSCLADELEVELTRSRNLAMLDLFDKRHARRVLAEYGRGYDRLPDQLTKLDSDQSKFLDEAIDGLAVEGKIVPVQLVTFAEIMKGRPWSTKSLQQIGGIDGVGIKFLDESFGPTAPAESRTHVEAVERVLALLLPETGSDLKGATKSEEELRQVAGYGQDRRRFAALLTILDNDLHLITPSDSKLQSKGETRQYQLTHDYLVPAIRGWLNRNLRATMRGRAMLSLADRSEVWNSRKENRHLPSWPEWFKTIVLTRASQWDEKQRRMMNVATKKHVLESVVVAVIVSSAMMLGYGWMVRSRAFAITEQLRTANSDDTTEILDQLEHNAYWSLPLLHEMADQNSAISRAGIHSRLGILHLLGSRSGMVDQLVDASAKINRDSLLVVLSELQRCKLAKRHVEHWWEIAIGEKSDQEEKVNAVLALASFAEDDPRWENQKLAFAEQLLRHMQFHTDEEAIITDHVRSSAQSLYEPFHKLFVEQSDSALGLQAQRILKDVWGGNMDRMIEIFVDSGSETMLPIAGNLDRFSPEVLIPKLHQVIRQNAAANDSDLCPIRQANASAYLLRKRSFSPHLDLLASHANLEIRTQIVERAALLDAPADYVNDLVQMTDDASVKAALLLLLGTSKRENFTQQSLEQSIEIGRSLFVSSPDAELHSAAWWMLGKLERTSQWLDGQMVELAGQKQQGTQDWYINETGQTFIRVDGPKQAIDVCVTEVTRGEFAEFDEEHPLQKDRQEFNRRCPTDQTPVILTDWFDAVAYCRWLTEQEGLGEEDQCYPPTVDEQKGVGIYSDFRRRRGYRLLFPDEWEHVCFGGTESTTFGWGNDPKLVSAYGSKAGQFQVNTSVTSMKPLPTGVFGMYGGVREWCVSRNHANGQQPIRGGDIDDTLADRIRLSHSGSAAKGTYYYSIGFRICRAAELIDEN